MALIPNPVGDVLKRVDGTLGTVDDIMRRVDGQLGDVNTTLAEVRSLLADLEEEMQLLRQVPDMAAKLDEIHRMVAAAA